MGQAPEYQAVHSSLICARAFVELTHIDCRTNMLQRSYLFLIFTQIQAPIVLKHSSALLFPFDCAANQTEV